MDPKTLKDIADKACIFDRAHFDDGNVPEPETFLRHHETLRADRKLITRLVPRYAVALGFFEGYVQAMVDLSSKAPETNDIGIVIRPPPPPPVAPPMPDEISDELARAAADYANGNPNDTIANDIGLVRYAMTRSRCEHAAWYGQAFDFVEGARWQLARTPRMPANEVQASERMQYEKTIELQRKRISELESQVAATAVQGAEWRDSLEQSEAERTEMKKERDRALAQVRTWEERTGETKPRIVEAKLSAKMPTDREIVDFLRSNAYPEVQGLIEAERSIEKLNASEDELRREMPKRNASLAEACAIKLALLHFIPQAKEESNDDVQAEGNVCIPAATKEPSIVESDPELQEFVREVCTQNEPSSSLVFRDESERDFWDEQVHAMNRRGDRTPSDVASAADEMVEERRKRMPVENMQLQKRVAQLEADDRVLRGHIDRAIEMLGCEVGESMFDVIAKLKERATNGETEITDELLLEAARFANRESNSPNGPDDIRDARIAYRGESESRWSILTHAYVNGALRKARAV